MTEEKKHTFSFNGYEFSLQTGTFLFFYSLEKDDKKYHFTEKILLTPAFGDISRDSLENILNNLLIMLGISYWKLTCAPNITLPFLLTQEQAKFWEVVYTNGLGEFFYRNGINPQGYIHFPFSKDHTVTTSSFPSIHNALVLFGGGKDSLVSVEILKKAATDFDLFIVSPSVLHKEVAGKTAKKVMTCERILDTQLFALNKTKGFYNGHIPISAVNAFLAVLSSMLYGYKYIIASHEKSADFGNVTFQGREVNHQWSKSSECEILLQQYITRYISPSITYFSLLRPFSEIKIAQLFSKYAHYFESFSSCNTNFRIDPNSKISKKWCGYCPKCLFVFLSLASFLSKREMENIFKKNLLADVSLIPLLKALLSIESTKPFECVGTPEEVLLALLYIQQKEEYTNDALIQFFNDNYKITDKKSELENQLLSGDKLAIDMLPDAFKTIVENL